MTHFVNKLKCPDYTSHNVYYALPKREGMSVNVRLALAVIPLASFYKPLSYPVSLIVKGERAYICVSEAIKNWRGRQARENTYAVFQSIVAVAALAGTFFKHPVGILISIGHDLIIDVVDVWELLNAKEEQNVSKQSKVQEKFLNIMNNALYLSLFLRGSSSLTIASLTMQIVTGLYHSLEELHKGCRIEAVGCLLMSVVRGIDYAYLDFGNHDSGVGVKVSQSVEPQRIDPSAVVSSQSVKPQDIDHPSMRLNLLTWLLEDPQRVANIGVKNIDGTNKELTPFLSAIKTVSDQIKANPKNYDTVQFFLGKEANINALGSWGTLFDWIENENRKNGGSHFASHWLKQCGAKSGAEVSKNDGSSS